MTSVSNPLVAQMVSVNSTAADALDVAGDIDVEGGLSVAGGVTFDLWDGMVVPFDGTLREHALTFPQERSFAWLCARRCV